MTDDEPITQKRRVLPLTMSERVDNLAEAMQLVTAMVQKCIAAAEQARNSSDHAVIAARETSGQIGMVARDVGVLRGTINVLKGKIETIEKTIGRWPTSPDDTGSGLAGRVAMTSAHRIELAPQDSEAPPKVLTTIWKKHRRLGIILATVGAVVYAILQTLAMTRAGGGSP